MRRLGIVMLAATVATAGCKTIVEEMPEDGQAASPSGPAPVRLETPTPTPEPARNPTPDPTPEPTPPPASASCSPGSGSGQDCPRTTPSFLDDVDAAIDQLAQDRPDLFKFNDTRGEGGWYVRDADAYHEGVAENLRAMGLCAMFDGEEIAVKRGNGFSDQYDIHLSSGHVRRGEGMYRATCRPAWF